MEITIKDKGKEKEIASNYEDAYTQYNKGVESIATVILQKAKIAINAVHSSEADIKDKKAEIERIQKEIEEITDKIESCKSNKSSEIQKMIEEERVKAINSAYAWSPKKIEEVIALLNKAKKDLEEYKKTFNPDACAAAEVSEESVRSEMEKDFRPVVDSYKMSSGVVDFYGHNYGTNCDGYNYTPEFSKLYSEISQDAYNHPEDTIDRYAEADNSVQAINGEFNNMYKRNPFILIVLLKWIFLFPIMHAQKVLGAMHCEYGTFPGVFAFFYQGFGFSKEDDKRMVPARQSSIWVSRLLVILWVVLILMFFIRFNIWVKLAVIGLVAVSFVLFNISKKSAQQDIERAIHRYLFLKSNYDNFEDEVRREVERRRQDARAGYVFEYNQRISDYNSEIRKYSDMYDKYQADNRKAKDDAALAFDPDKIDMSQIEKIFNDKINALVSSGQSAVAKLQRLEEEIAPAQAKLNEAKAAKQRTIDSLIAFLSKGEKIDGCKVEFPYFFKYINIYASMHGTESVDGLGFSVYASNGKIPYLRSDNDIALPNKHIAIGLTPLNAEGIAKRIGIEPTDEIMYVYENVIKSSAKEFEAQAKDMLARNRDKESAKGLDLTNLYLVKSIENNCKCSVVFYDSNKNKDFRSTLSELITRNIYKSTLWTTNPAAVGFTFAVMDKTELIKFDPRTHSSEEARRKLDNSKAYTIVKGDVNNEIKALHEKALNFQNEVHEKSCDSALEYQVNKIISGTQSMFYYLILWLDKMDYLTEDLYDIMQWSGGSQAGGSTNDAENICGVIPIIFIDSAEFAKERPDESLMKGIQRLAETTNYRNFFEIGADIESLRRTDRDRILELISKTIEKAKMK